MPVTVLTTRALPLPRVEAAGEELRFVPLAEAGAAAPRALLTTAIDRVDAAMIAALPRSVGLIANLGVGTDNIDLAAAWARGIRVSNTPVVAEDTADLAFALILAACRQVVSGDRYLRAGKWEQGLPPAPETRVHGARLGLVGFGAIGQAVARRAAGFRMAISYWACGPKPEGAGLNAVHVASLDQLVAQSDIVSLHLPLTTETRHLFDAERLARFRPGAVLINTGRGALIDEAALVAALEAGTIAAAGLDVFEREPRVHPGLLAIDRVVLTPHIGSATNACRQDMAARALANLIAFIETGEPLDRVQ